MSGSIKYDSGAGDSASAAGPGGTGAWRVVTGAAGALVVLLAVAYPSLPLVRYGAVSGIGRNGLGYVVLAMLTLAVAAPVVAVVAPTLGRLVDRKSSGASPNVASFRFAALAAAVAAVSALVALVTIDVDLWLPVVNLVVPAAIAGFVSRRWLTFWVTSRLRRVLLLVLATAMVIAAAVAVFGRALFA